MGGVKESSKSKEVGDIQLGEDGVEMWQVIRNNGWLRKNIKIHDVSPHVPVGSEPLSGDS